MDSEIFGITSNARDNKPHVKVEHSFHVVEGMSVDHLIGLDFFSLYEGNVDVISRFFDIEY